ncbi:MAG: RtcB family protein [Deltaproteobacteria bacterium]|nr:RtcB family protein [Deltaproteobacteria bacterium]
MGLPLRRVEGDLWEIPRHGRMKVPARIFSAGPPVPDDPALQQVVHVAHLPGILRFALAMPDFHPGYGFPIGGVAAVDAERGAVSPGGVGYDINCGVRLVATALEAAPLRPLLATLAAALFAEVPAGVGACDALPRLSPRELREVLVQGARWAVARGFGAEGDDVERCEEGGRLAGADPEGVGERARQRGSEQLGTLGSGNHFLELDEVAEVLDEGTAAAFGLFPGQLVFQIHSGSRGLGHQVCQDALAALARRQRDFGPDYAALPDPQLAAAPVESDEGRAYLSAMAAAANFAWANRQVMTGLALRALRRALGLSEGELRARLVYDVCHNVAKREEHEVEGRRRAVLVHRKGATRSFGPGDERVPACYRAVGQPVLVPGDMGRSSFVLCGAPGAMRESFGSCAHGAGRLLSRHQALRAARGRSVGRELREQGVEVLSRDHRTLAEEMPEAYRDVSRVVAVVAAAGLATLVARLRPLAVVKG